VNKSIVRLFGFCLVLFGLLIGWTSRWSVFDATALNDNPLNKRAFLEDLLVKRGRIVADDGTVLARSVKARGGTWRRVYPTGSLFAQAVGYSIPSKAEATGLERSRASELAGEQTGISSVLGPLGGRNRVGDDVHTTLDPAAQRLAVQLLAGRAGAVVALDVRTGAVKVLYANPTYNDNKPSGGSKFDAALQSGFPPGSTFKIVTTTAALDTGRYTPDSQIDGKSPLTVSGVPLENDGNTSWGEVTLTKALTYSINTVFAQLGESLGVDTMATYMKRFGFYGTPPLDFPQDEMAPSGERNPRTGELLSPTSGLIDVGRMAIGQDKLAVTPLQMAMVAAAVANGGRLMVPHLTSEVVNQDGQVVERIEPQVYDQVMKPKTAAEVTAMMTDVVEEGTGTAANLDGVKVAGKTGTATIVTGSDLDDAWFIGFGPVEHPQVAVAVVLERIANGYGGVYAAPIAAQMIKKLLAEGQ
jgi:penicillin-binding protein A